MTLYSRRKSSTLRHTSFGDVYETTPISRHMASRSLDAELASHLPSNQEGVKETLHVFDVLASWSVLMSLLFLCPIYFHHPPAILNTSFSKFFLLPCTATLHDAVRSRQPPHAPVHAHPQGALPSTLGNEEMVVCPRSKRQDQR